MRTVGAHEHIGASVAAPSTGAFPPIERRATHG